MAIARTIAASVHGRYLIEMPTHAMPAGVIAGCHGYAETAEIQMERLRGIPGADRWALVSIQALHPFYRGRPADVVASWMTRQDRELAIRDNVGYVEAVIDEVARDAQVDLPVLYTGFSQGVAMAFRAACAATRTVLGVVAVGGDVPPELSADTLRRLPTVLVARGGHDVLYTSDQWAADQTRLRAAGVAVRTLTFDGGHEWHPDVSRETAAIVS